MAPLTDRLLMGPGPSNPYPEAIQGLTRPLLGHLDPEFLTLLDETNEGLRRLFGTTNRLTLPISGTGSAGMEALVVNTVGPGDVVVVGINGVFGGRIAEVARRAGAEVVAVEAPWGRALDPQQLLEAHPSPKVIAVVHAETSTGVRNDIASLGQGKGDALLLVDMVTSLGGIATAVDEWGVDLAYAGTQKCLGVPPGLSPITVSERAVERFVDSPSWYLDLGLIGAYAVAGSPRTYHHTAPVAMVAALHGALGAIEAEGRDEVIERHEAVGRTLHQGLERAGFTLWAQNGHRLPQLTTVEVPGGIDEAAVRSRLLRHHGIEIGAGLGPAAGTVWRIGCMGHTARPRNVATVLAAIAECTGR